jgi:magnesium transporter
MLRFAKKASKKAGLPPGTLMHIGETKTEKMRITVIDYDETHFQEREVKRIEECLPLIESPTATWINVSGLHQVDIIEKMGDYFGLHPLVLEDILNTEHHPKIEDHVDYLFVVLKMVRFDEESSEIRAEQVSIVLGPNFVISFEEQEGEVFNHLRDRIKNRKGRVRKMKVDYLAYCLLDVIIDQYFIILEKLGERIVILEEELISEPEPATLQQLYTLKRELLFLRRSAWPLREVVNELEKGECPLIDDSTAIYLRDVYDHTIRVIDTIEIFRDMVTGMFEVYLSSVSNKMNEVMKVLTIIATIFIPLTFIAGIYGMNFRYMPELEWHWGYPLLWFVMISVAGLMLVSFRKKRWL